MKRHIAIIAACVGMLGLAAIEKASAGKIVEIVGNQSPEEALTAKPGAQGKTFPAAKQQVPNASANKTQQGGTFPIPSSAPNRR